MTANRVLFAAILGLLPTCASAAENQALPRGQAGERESRAEEANADSPESALDPAIRKMIETAMASGDGTAVVKVLTIARQVAPAAGVEIDALEKAWKADIADREAQLQSARMAKLRSASPLENWKGEIELGAYRSTGTSSNLGVLGSVELEREGIEWSHKLSGRAEVQSTDGETTTERLFAAWQPKYGFQGQAYAFGLAQYEHDPFAGYDHRYTLGAGLGYRAIAGDRLQLDLEGGPAFRHTDEIEGLRRSHLVGRGSLNLKVQLTPTLKLAHETAVYLEDGDSNAAAITTLDTKLIGNLQARFSYNVQYEGNPPSGTHALNTQSRATFVYSF